MGKHIIESQRYQIEALIQVGHNQSQIAEIIGKHKSVISREINRNKLSNGIYKAKSAQVFYQYTRSRSGRSSKFENNTLVAFIEDQIREDKSPEQIAGIMKNRLMEQTLSHESIYQYIWEDKRKGGSLHKHLRNKGRRYRKRGRAKDSRGIIADRISIEHRPVEVEQKARVGDLEIDLIIGANHKQAILTVVERKSGMAWIRKVTDKSALAVQEQLLDVLKPIQKYVYTITSDNGKEFANHKAIAVALDAAFYFAHPYHSWERGCNENYNRLLRQYFPKKSDFTTITDEQLKQVQNKINNRERKRLGFISPIQYLHIHSLTKVAFAT